LVLFVGAGASRDAGLPTWAELVQPLRKELRLGLEADLLDVAQFYSDSFGRRALLRRVSSALVQVHKPGHLHRALARVPAPVIFTTNYDRLLERALEQAQGVPPDV